jgi:hypothetical protein
MGWNRGKANSGDKAIRGRYLITFLFVGFVLALSYIAFAQSLGEVTAREMF